MNNMATKTIKKPSKMEKNYETCTLQISIPAK